MFTRKCESQATDLQCVFYHMNGLVDELLPILKQEGHKDITADDVRERACTMIKDHNILDPDSNTCYFCGLEKEPGTLCSCFKKRYLTVTNVPTIMEQFPDEKIIETLICRDCGKKFSITARWAKGAHKKNRNYYSPTRCTDCFQTHKAEKGFAKIGDTVDPAVLDLSPPPAKDTGKSAKDEKSSKKRRSRKSKDEASKEDTK